MREALTGFELLVLTAALSQRVAFAESAATGQTVLETEPHGSAANEVRSLVAEILEMMNDGSVEEKSELWGEASETGR